MAEQLLDAFDTQNLTWGRLLGATAIMVLFYVLSRFVRRGVTHRLRDADGVSEGTPEPVGRISGWAVVLLGIVLGLMVLGFQMGPIVLLLGIFGAIGAIAGKGVLENFSAGLSLQLTQPFKVGDRIETKDASGWVEAINSHAVILQTTDGRRVHIPNRDVLDSVIRNYTDTKRRRSELHFSIAFGEDFARGREVAVEAAISVGVVEDEPEPVAYIDGLSSGVDFRLRFYHDDEDRWEARDKVAESLVAALDEEGIALMTPEVIIRQPELTDERPKRRTNRLKPVR